MKKNHHKIDQNYLLIFLIFFFSALLFFVFSSKDFVSKGHQNEREESTKASKKELKDAYSFFSIPILLLIKKLLKLLQEIHCKKFY
jgi:Na+/H+ antiporter NhaC